MIKYMYFVFILFAINIVYCQDYKNEKLKKLPISKNDTLKIQLLIDTGNNYFYSNPDSTFNYFSKALTISKNIKSEKFEALSLLNLGFYYENKELYQESLDYYLKAIELYKLVNNESGIADCYNYIGYSFAYLNSLENAYKYYTKALHIYKNLDDRIGLAQVYNGLGSIYFEQENYSKSEEYYLKTLTIYENLNDKSGILSSFILVGNAISEGGDITKGLEYYYKSIKLSEELKDYEGLAVNYTNIGDCYLLLGDFTKAQKYLSKAIEISDNYNYKSFYPSAYAKIAKIKLKLKKYDEAILYADKSLNASKNVTWAYKEYDAHSYLSSAYEELGNYKKAYENHKLYKNFSDSIFSIKQKEQITKLDILQTLETKENQIDLLEENEEIKTLQLKNQQLVNYALIVFILFSIGLIFSLYKQQKIRKKAFNLVSIEKQKAIESDRLKSSFLANMSHEIRTPMNAIMGFSSFLKNPDLEPVKRDRFVDIITNSGERLMTIINDIIDISKIESNQLKVDVKEEVNVKSTLKEVIEIQKNSNSILMKKSINLVLSAPLSQDDLFIKTDQNRFVQILNNLINNAIKFTENGFVEVGYKLVQYNQNLFIEFYVKDTGCGISKDKFNLVFDRFSQAGENDFKTGNGLGLSICKGLVTILGGEIWLESEKGVGTTFYFKLPY